MLSETYLLSRIPAFIGINKANVYRDTQSEWGGKGRDDRVSYKRLIHQLLTEIPVRITLACL